MRGEESGLLHAVSVPDIEEELLNAQTFVVGPCGSDSRADSCL